MIYLISVEGSSWDQQSSYLASNGVRPTVALSWPGPQNYIDSYTFLVDINLQIPLHHSTFAETSNTEIPTVTKLLSYLLSKLCLQSKIHRRGGLVVFTLKKLISNTHRSCLKSVGRNH